MTAATRVARYFVLIVDGQPLTHEGSQDVPVIFRDEETALATGRHLYVAQQPQAVTVEAYADDYTFVGRRRVDVAVPLVVQQS